jgi:3-oxoacyl-[acyl-carrier-protein] synthase II
VLALKFGEVPPTLNYEDPDPACPVNVLREPLREPQQVALVLNQSTMGHAVALLIGTV